MEGNPFPLTGAGSASAIQISPGTAPPPNPLFSSSPSPAPEEHTEKYVEITALSYPTSSAPSAAPVAVPNPELALSASELASSGPNAPKRSSPPSQDHPALKRERKDSSQEPPRVLHEIALIAWDSLLVRFPESKHFTPKEICDAAEQQWASASTSQSEKPPTRFRRDFVKFVKRNGGMFRRTDGGDAQAWYVVMNDRTFKVVPPKRKSTDLQASKRCELPVNSVEGGEDGAEGFYVRASVPAEWTNVMYKPVRLSPFDKSVGVSFMNVAQSVVTAMKGFRTIRATTGVCSGDWFFEATVLPNKNSKAALRLGWSMRRSDVETPVGFDTYGFGLRDRTGEFVHIGYRKPYGENFGVGDVIGCRIVLPDLTEEQHKRVLEADEKWLQWRFLAYKQGAAPPDSGVYLNPRGRVEFYKNGRSMGVPSVFPQPMDKTQNVPATERLEKSNDVSADSDKTTRKEGIVAGYYFPSISMFKDAVAEVNFGPDFKFGLPDGSKPMSDSAKDRPGEVSTGELAGPAENGHAHHETDKPVPENQSMPLVTGQGSGRMNAELEIENGVPSRSERDQLANMEHLSEVGVRAAQVPSGDLQERMLMNSTYEAYQHVREEQENLL